MKTFLLGFVFATAVLGQSAKWQPLFDGKSLSGWKSEGDAHWEVKNGAMFAGMSGDGCLRTAEQYRNFALRLEFRNSPKGNSGIFLRAGEATKPMERCNPETAYELQINNEEPDWATGSMEGVIQRSVAVNPEPDRWHRFEIRVHGDHFVVHLDGKKVLDGRDGRIANGFIGLQHHKDSPIFFRSISIQPIP